MDCKSTYEELEERVEALGSELKEADKKSSAWLEHSPVCTKIVDLDLNLQYMSSAGIQGLGIEDITQYYGKPYPLEFYPESFRITMTGNLESVRETGEIITQEAPVVDLEGNEAWFHSTIVPVNDEKGQIDYFMVVSIDITSRKRAEEERRKMGEAIQNTQKLESLGVLAGGIAHDFNNLLMSILGNADLALQELSPVSPANENVKEILTASRRAAELCKQMLAYSGKGKFEVNPINISEVVEEMTHMLEVSISKKAVLKYNFADNLPTIIADATQLRQIIMNLITNASDAVGDKSGVISISTGAMDCDHAYLSETYLDDDLPEGLYTYIEIADTGCGMNKETIKKLFDPFFTTKFVGRGLGLSAVLGIVRGHKGAIKVYSELKKGTTIKVLFPAVDEQAGSIQHETISEIEEWRGSGTVLLVDDEESVLAVGKQNLKKKGFSVLMAADGREGLELFRKHAGEIVCVILDLTMPRMDGEEAYREIRRIKSGVRVIMSSGYNEQDITQRFVGKGLAGFIQKPYTSRDLWKKLREILDE